MAAQWFCQMAGSEVGPLSSQQVKMMVASGRLLPGDSIRQGPSGPWIPAARVKGLFPAVQTPAKPSAGGNSPAAKNGRSLPVAQKTTPAKPATNPGKKPAGGQPGTVRAAKPIVVPARQAQKAAPAQESGNGDFPEELAGGIPKPKKGFNFDRLAIDTTPVKVTGRKTSRVGGMNKNERTKVMRIMAGGIGGALLLSAIMMADLLHRSPQCPQAAAGCHGIGSAGFQCRRLLRGGDGQDGCEERRGGLGQVRRKARQDRPGRQQRGRGRTSGILEIQGHHQNGPEKRRLILTSPWVPISRPEFVGNHKQP